MVWYGYFLELPNVIPCRHSKENKKGILGVREGQGVHEEGGTGTPARMLLLFTV